LIPQAPQFRILMAIEAVDGRKGIDALAQFCREKLRADPYSGCVFIFRTRRGTAIKLLAYDFYNVIDRCLSEFTVEIRLQLLYGRATGLELQLG
jgi:hypothetical protein